MNQKFIKITPMLFLMISLASCSNTAPAEMPSPTPVLEEIGNPTGKMPEKPSPTGDMPADPSLTAGPTGEAGPFPTDASDLSPTGPEAGPTPAEGAADIPALNFPAWNTACMYMNYSNSFPLIQTENSEVRFFYDDTVMVTTATGSTSIRLSEQISLDGEDLSDPEAWFFCGAFQAGGILYAHYDYLNGEAICPSLLIRIDPLAAAADCCIHSWNPKKTFSDSFAAVGETLYYTRTEYSGNEAASFITSTGLDGSHPSDCIACAQGETIPYMTSDGKFLYFVVTDEKAVNRLICFDPATGSQKVISSKLSPVDFLAALDGFLLTSVQNNTLRYCSQEGKAFTLKITADTSLTAGAPMTDGSYLYIPLLDYSEEAATRVAVVSLTENQIVEELLLDDTFYYCIGMANQYLYAENADDFLVFDLFEYFSEN